MQRIFILTAALAVAMTFASPGAFAQAKKSKLNCSYEACVAACNTRGGQPRGCGDYCTKQMSQRKAAGQC